MSKLACRNDQSQIEAVPMILPCISGIKMIFLLTHFLSMYVRDISAEKL